MKENIITRIAPSPTGLFHIGTARTALFNYLFSKKHNGKFILRIEDTDSKRSEKKYIQDIIDGLKWLDLKWDGNIFYQSQRQKIYQKYIQKLLKENKAYSKDGAIWFDIAKYPKDKIKYHDMVLGDLEFDKANFNDFVLIKSDKTPLYMFAAVVDDFDMQISHIIRGDDHVNSTPQQIMIYESLGFKLPKFAHIPMILNTDRSKMSKRKNPVSISADFKNKGYLPQAMINYMVLLGWNPKNNQEIFTIDKLTDHFDIKKINRSPAIFDIEKLNYFNNYYIKNMDSDMLLSQILKYNPNTIVLKNIDRAKILKIIDITKSRMNNLSDFIPLTRFIYKMPKYNYQMLIFKKSTKEKTLSGLKYTYQSLTDSDEKIWKRQDSLNHILLSVVKKYSLSNGDIFWPIRVALSGLEKSPSPVELLWVLEKKESLSRIKKSIQELSK
jgi:glutamyl-tRNA synthetase